MKIRYLLMNAYGANDTVRTVVGQANAFAAHHEVDLVSVFRHRETPAVQIDSRVHVVPLLDTRRIARPARPPRALPYGEPGEPAEPGREGLTGVTGRLVTHYLRTLSDGVVVGTGPALNTLTARFAPPGVVRVAWEQRHLGAHKPRVAAQIRRWYPALDAIVVLTEADERAYRRTLGASRARLERIPNALPPWRRRRSALDRKLVTAAGGLVKDSGFDALIDAFEPVARSHPGWRLHIHGEGGQRTRLTRRIQRRRLHDNVLLRGPSGALHDELAEAAAHAFSSRSEGVETALVEAMRHGLPVVGFDYPYGPREVITHRRDGVLVPAGDVSAFAAALDRLVGDREARRRMGAHAYDTAARYEMSHIHPRWERLFTDLCLAALLRPVLL